VSLEFISGIRTVQAFAAQDLERSRFCDATEASNQSRRIQASIEPVSEGVYHNVHCMLIHGVLIPNGQLQSAELLTFLFYCVSCHLASARWSRVKISTFQGPLSSIKELLRTDNKTYLQNGLVQFSGLQRAIEFVAVDFGYDASTLLTFR